MYATFDGTLEREVLYDALRCYRKVLETSAFITSCELGDPSEDRYKIEIIDRMLEGD